METAIRKVKRRDRLDSALGVIGLFAVLGPTLGGIWLLVYLFAVDPFTPGDMPDALVAAALVSTPISSVFMAQVLGMIPAAFTGLLLAAEFVFRGRVSWISAIAAPLIAVAANALVFAPELVDNYLMYGSGLGASLTFWAVWLRRMRDVGVQRDRPLPKGS